MGKGGIRIGGNVTNNLRYEYDMAVIVETELK